MKSYLRQLSFIMLFLLFICNQGKTQSNADVLVIGTIHNNHAVSNYSYNDILRVLDTKCYDLEGKRDLAKDYYNKSMNQLRADKKERLIDFVVTPYLNEPYKK